MAIWSNERNGAVIPNWFGRARDDLSVIATRFEPKPLTPQCGILIEELSLAWINILEKQEFAMRFQSLVIVTLGSQIFGSAD